ncbi:MAG: sulfate reduction electron transfer complex DsrMKJOP subunit DsrM [candidate division Zixibacteria bacterium]|nr:sulfate reduction electron transfer complex DsrMKJOP subunit DsrM [candidate division Zixibacteria bacterium]
MGVMFSLLAVVVLILIAVAGTELAGWRDLFGIVIPYAAVVAFVIGVIYRVLKWARSAVPFRIPTTCGQQKTLPWIKSSKLDNPHNLFWVLCRMFLEVFFFRSLFRNTRSVVVEGPRILYSPTKWLWAAGMAFHWSLLIVLIRHCKYFIEPVPSWLVTMQNLDGFFQIGLPIILTTDVVIVASLTFLFLRRVVDQKLRYLSLPADYFPLFLLLGITVSGVFMRYFTKTDLVSIKELAIGLVSFSPVVSSEVGLVFFVHIFLVSVLLAYIPLSKLMHFAGVFMSPTRNLANNNRVRRHINPWNPKVKVHTYEEYEDEYRDLMKAAGLPVDKEE